jgi:multimeric flavodoxin WrbA
MKRLVVIAHDPSPNTKAMVQAVLKGAGDKAIDGVEVAHFRPLDAGAEDALEADAVIFGTTENLGYMSGALKDFFDRCFYDLLDKTDAMPYAMFIRAGKDGTGTRRAIESICQGLNWKPVQEPLICRGEWDDHFPDQCRELGLAMAAALEAEII